MIEFANKNDIPEISELWQTIFDEDKSICDLFFDKIFSSSFAPIYRVGNEIASALFLLPCRFGKFSGFCVYCAMTRENHRGKGFMKELLSFSYDFVKEKNLDFLFLVPAEKSLFEYYKKCGFITFGTKNIINISECKKNCDNIHTCSENEYLKVRSENLNNINKLEFPDDIIKYWIASCNHYGGEAIADNHACALIFPDDNEVIIRDLIGDKEKILSYAEGKYPERKITVEKGSGMIKADNKQLLESDYYIGITLE